MKGFNVPCIKCGEESCVRVNLHNIEEFSCSSCDTEFTLEEVQEFMSQWQKAIKWLNSAPSND